MSDFVQVSLATMFLTSCPIVCWDSIIFLLCLSNNLFFSFSIYLICTMILCAASLIILISRWIEASLLYFCNKSRALFNSSWLLLCSSFFMCVKRGLFCSNFASQFCILLCENCNSLLKLLNKYFLVDFFIVLLFFHIGIQFFYICKSMLCLCWIVDYVLPVLGCLFLGILTSPSSLSTYPKA